MWVLDHVEDLESDFLRFHGVQDIRELDGPRFFRLAWRISAYGGVMTARLHEMRLRTAREQGLVAQPQQYRPAIQDRMPARVAVSAGARVVPFAAFGVETGGGAGGEVVHIKKKTEVA